MIDDFASTAAMSALSIDETPGGPDSSAHASLYSGLNDSADDEDHDSRIDSPAPDEPDATHTVSAWARTGLSVSICRGAGDDRYVDGLVAGLRSLGWDVEIAALPATTALRTSPPRMEPVAATQSSGRMRVALGLGLGASLAMWQGQDARLGRVDGVVAVCPFLGFNAPIYRGTDSRLGGLKQRAFGYASRPSMRVFASRIECVSAYVGLGPFVSHALSWADVADCASHADFSGVLRDCLCPTAIILDAEDPALDAERARSQIPAMNMMASVDIRPLSGPELLRAVDHALFSVLRYHQQAQDSLSPPATTQGASTP